MVSKPKSILIVDDNDAVRNAFVYLFTYSGFRVWEASDGFEALAAMRAEAPDILLSDLDMPAMSGFELLPIVRRRFPSVGVVAMSGTISCPSALEGIAAEAFYAKGTSCTASLLKSVQTLLERGVSSRNFGLMGDQG